MFFLNQYRTVKRHSLKSTMIDDISVHLKFKYKLMNCVVSRQQRLIRQYCLSFFLFFFLINTTSCWSDVFLRQALLARRKKGSICKSQKKDKVKNNFFHTRLLEASTAFPCHNGILMAILYNSLVRYVHVGERRKTRGDSAFCCVITSSR